MAFVEKELLAAKESASAKAELFRSRGWLHTRMGEPKAATADYSAAVEWLGASGTISDDPRPIWLAWLEVRAKADSKSFDPTPVTRLMPPAEAGLKNLSWHREACLRLAAGDRDGYRRLIEMWIEGKVDRLGNAGGRFFGPDPHRTLALVPNPPDVKPPPVTAIPKTQTRGKEFAGGYGAYLYRIGKDREALEWLVAAADSDPDGGDGWSCVFLALVHHRFGDREQAARWWAKARTARDQIVRTKSWHVDVLAAVKSRQFLIPDGPVVNLRVWWEWVELELLWPEVEAVLGPERDAGGTK
jgi:tetratricopeptide (TPR) repeat protein